MIETSNLFDKLKLIGNGGCFASDLKNTSFYYKDGDTLCIFECNMDTFRFLKNEWKKVYNGGDIVICISHLHEDHVGGLGSFLMFLLHAVNISSDKVTIICPDYEDMIDYLDSVAGFMPYYHSVTDEDYQYKGENGVTRTISLSITSHVSDILCCGFKVDNEFYYTGDTWHPNDDMIAAFNSGELKALVAEVTLCDPSEVHTPFSFYRKNIKPFRFNMIQFVHFDNAEAVQEVSRMVKRILKENIES